MGTPAKCRYVSKLWHQYKRATQMMLEKSELHSDEHSIMISTDPDHSKRKTKCGSKLKLTKPALLQLCDRELPLVVTPTHLGRELHQPGSIKYDAVIKRAIFINRMTSFKKLNIFTISGFTN
jgi:hypothetical protein